MMRVFKSKSFNKFAASEGISDVQLVDVVREMENGLFEAELGGVSTKSGLQRKVRVKVEQPETL
ncbi:hypothetical protein FS373_18130 [Shewanella sp. YLB-07]|nr:type II toxin-antitoxin system RelE/ParE family toxin [Shewanella sp. YLB-07]MPY24434.1 hypothetical protein [Shewanella sp. YLB-07]